MTFIKFIIVLLVNSILGGVIYDGVKKLLRVFFSLIERMFN